MMKEEKYKRLYEISPDCRDKSKGLEYLSRFLDTFESGLHPSMLFSNWVMLRLKHVMVVKFYSTKLFSCIKLK